MVFSLSALWLRRIWGLWKLPDGRDWLRGKLGLVLMGGAVLSKFLIQFSVKGRGCVPSRLFDRGQTMVEVMKIMVASFKGSRACTAALCAPNPAAGHHDPRLHWRPLGTHGKSGPVSCGVTAPFSWVLLCTRFCLCPPGVCFPSPVYVLAALW